MSEHADDGLKAKVKRFYEKHLNHLLIIPMLMLLLAIMQITAQLYITGDVVDRGVSLKGGSTLTIPVASVDEDVLKSHLVGSLPGKDIEVRKLGASGLIIEAADVKVNELISATEQKLGKLSQDQYAAREIGSSLGSSFFTQMIWALFFAFLCMSIVVFVTFRSAAPSAMVILAAFSDIVVTLAVFNLSDMKLSSAGIAAFLMLVGYSVDTDILLTTNVLRKHHPALWDRIYMSIATGFTMLACTISATIVALIFFDSETIRQIMTIILIGLAVDMVMTWIQNVALIKWWADKHGVK
ncbi:hypothetical protein HY641_00635 [Candidatus Woesearchaeota archaeon]|nr:hypothetical protein [Candidatus Woesearchaeota archaeon]